MSLYNSDKQISEEDNFFQMFLICLIAMKSFVTYMTLMFVTWFYMLLILNLTSNVNQTFYACIQFVLCWYIPGCLEEFMQIPLPAHSCAEIVLQYLSVNTIHEMVGLISFTIYIFIWWISNRFTTQMIWHKFLHFLHVSFSHLDLQMLHHTFDICRVCLWYQYNFLSVLESLSNP